MASGGSSGRASSDPRSFDFGSDNVLCAYDDFTNQDLNNGKRSDSSGKDFNESRTGRSWVNVQGQQEVYRKEVVTSAVEKCMKKYADNLLRHLEGISGRLSQLEIYCYKLERSIGEFRADVIRDQSESDTKLKSLEKHLQEVHRSIQILRDKQELAETQNELAKLQRTAIDDSSATPPQKTQEVSAASLVSESKSLDSTQQEIPNQHLALAIPHQIPTSRAPDQDHLPVQQPGLPQQDCYIMNQTVPFYTQQSQSLQTEQLYIQNRLQPPSPTNQTQYQQQWTQQPFAAPPQQPNSQTQLVRPQNPPTYLSYTPTQPASPETFSYSTISLPGGTRVDTVPIAYRPTSGSHNIPTPVKVSGYLSLIVPYPPQPNLHGYSRVYQPVGYAPPASSQQQMTRSHHLYGDVIEKAVGMGYARQQVVRVVNRMVESGQPVDFNALLNRLNSLLVAAGGAVREWVG